MMRLAMLIGALGFMACASDAGDALPSVDCKSGAAVPTFAQVDAFTTCKACHSSTLSGANRKEAPADINFDTYADAKAHAEKAASEVSGGAMPPADSKLTVSQSAKDTLYRWALCGTPE
jgi:uncharacterized membrane protein